VTEAGHAQQVADVAGALELGECRVGAGEREDFGACDGGAVRVDDAHRARSGRFTAIGLGPRSLLAAGRGRRFTRSGCSDRLRHAGFRRWLVARPQPKA
jgi:hypothetical protein